jgi:osmotically-inducible protein OsmY
MTPIRFALSVATAGLMLGGVGLRAVADQTSAAADAKEEQAIHAQFRKSPDLENQHIAVTVDDGIAVLEGTVDTPQEKTEAQALAHVDGILGVNNRLEVRGPGSDPRYP